MSAAEQIAAYCGQRVRVRFDYGEVMAGRVTRQGSSYVLRRGRGDWSALLSMQDRVIAIKGRGHRFVSVP